MIGIRTAARVLGELRRDISAAHERDPAARGVSALEILATWPGVHALLAHRVAHALNEAGVPVAPRTIAAAARTVTGIEIHPCADVGDGLFIDHGMGVVIGETAEIGENVTLYQGVTLGGTGFATGKRHPTVEDNVTIGSGAKLLGPIRIGHGAKIGANAVVVHDVPPNSTVVGNPGHPVRVEGRKPEGPDADWVHLPDPIADALKALSKRIAELEPSSTRSAAASRRSPAPTCCRCGPCAGRTPPAGSPCAGSPCSSRSSSWRSRRPPAPRTARSTPPCRRGGATRSTSTPTPTRSSPPRRPRSCAQRIDERGAGPMYVAFLPRERGAAVRRLGRRRAARSPADGLNRPGTYVLVAGRTFRAGSTDMRRGRHAEGGQRGARGAPGRHRRDPARLHRPHGRRPLPGRTPAASPPSSRSPSSSWSSAASGC